jgi:hypothetical protein
MQYNRLACTCVPLFSSVLILVRIDAIAVACPLLPCTSVCTNSLSRSASAAAYTLALGVLLVQLFSIV